LALPTVQCTLELLQNKKLGDLIDQGRI